MKKTDITNSFKTKKFRYGGYATLTTAIILAIVLVVNLMAVKLDWKVDLTKNKIYSISDQTYKILDNLKKNINIYVFYESGKEDPTLKTILEKYSARSKNVTVEYKDPIKYPQFAKKYSGGQDIGQGSIVVESGSKFRLINASDLANYSYEDPNQPKPESLAVEQRVTSAIVYVTSDKSPVIYNLQGHGETAVPEDISKQLGFQNYTVQDLNLLTKDAKLNNEGTLLIMSPKKDLTTEESDKLKSFFSNGGRAVVLMDITKDDLPNFQALLGNYGVGMQKAIVVEGDPNYSANNPIYLLPQLAAHEIVSPLKSNNLPVIIPVAQGIDIQKVKRPSLTVDPILTTSKNSWGKKNLEATTAEKEAGDLAGPFNVAVAITDKAATQNVRDTKIVLVANAVFTTPQFVSTAGNMDFLMNSFNWLQDNKDAISITAKSFDMGSLTMNTLQQLLYSGIVVIVIPAIIIIMGIMVWLRRRHQ